MPYDEATAKTLIDNLTAKETELNVKAGDIRSVKGMLQSLLDIETNETNPDGTPKHDTSGKPITKTGPPNDRGTGKAINTARRNEIFDVQSARATTLLT